MTEATALKAKAGAFAQLTVLDGGLSCAPAPAAQTHLGLRRAAEIVEGAAYELAGRESAHFVSRLIEIAAELDRHSRAERPEGQLAVGS